MVGRGTAMVLVALATVGLAAATPALASSPVVSVAAPTPLPASAKPDGGLRVGLRAAGDAATARRAIAEIVPSRRASRLVVTVAASGAADARGATRTTLAPPPRGRATRLQVPWNAPRDGAGTVVVAVRALDRRGRLAATSRATLYVLRSAGRVLTSTAGPLELELRRVNLLSALGRLTSALRLRRLDAVLGGGATTALSTRAAPAPTITVGGTIRFTDSAGATHPARQTQVELRETALTGDSTLLRTVSTGDDGRYVATIDAPAGAADVAHAAGYNLFVRALAAGPGYAIEGPKGVHRIDSSIARNTKRGTAVTLDLTANNTADNNTAFGVGEATYELREYLRRLAIGVPTIRIHYPSALGCSCYDYSNDELYLLRDDRFDFDVIQHEYGHFVSDRLGIQDNPGGLEHTIENLSEEHHSKVLGIPLAWAEAWPSYFATSAQQVMNEAARGIPNLGDTRYTDTEDSTYTYDLESQSGHPSGGEDGEQAIQRFLWDVFDAAKDPGDNVAFGDAFVMNALRAAQARSFSAAYASLVADLAPRQRGEIGCIATQHRMAPAITAPAARTPIAETPPTFTWTPNGGGPSYRNDSFVVQLYDGAFTTVVAVSTRLSAPRWQPSAALWDQIRAGRKALNVVVRGSQTAPPATGPYDSCPLALGG